MDKKTGYEKSYPVFQLVENEFFDKLTEVTKADKTSNSLPSAYIDTVGSELRSKSKHLA